MSAAKLWGLLAHFKDGSADENRQFIDLLFSNRVVGS